MSAITFSRYTHIQKIVNQRIKILGILKIKMSSKGSQSWLRSVMPGQGSKTWLRSPMSHQGRQIRLRSPMSIQGSQTWLRSPMSSQGSQTWLRSHMSERGDPYDWYVGRVWRYQEGGQNPKIEKDRQRITKWQTTINIYRHLNQPFQ
jgi:hypothetical protein